MTVWLMRDSIYASPQVMLQEVEKLYPFAHVYLDNPDNPYQLIVELPLLGKRVIAIHPREVIE